jgi:hypothetical protein
MKEMSTKDPDPLPGYATVDILQKHKARKEKFEKEGIRLQFESAYQDVQVNESNNDVYEQINSTYNFPDPETYSKVADTIDNKDDTYDDPFLG